MSPQKRTRSSIGRKFRLIDQEGWLGGVCAGIGYYFAIPVWMARLGFFLLLMATGVGVVPYLLLWIFVPNADRTPADYEERCG